MTESAALDKDFTQLYMRLTALNAQRGRKSITNLGRRMMKSHSKAILIGVYAALLAGCALGPDYAKPEIAAPTEWAASLPYKGRVDKLVDWWGQFNDPVLRELILKAEADSPSLAKAMANIDKSRATLTMDRASGLPSLTLDGSAERQKQVITGAGATISNLFTGTLDASWEIDLFGKVRRNTEAAEARAEARVADWHDARISLAAEVADDYVQYIACRQLAKTYDQSAESQKATARVTARLVRAGLTSSSDGDLTEADAESAAATATEQRAACEILVKALVDVTGIAEPSLRALLGKAPDALSRPEKFTVDAVPVNVLQRRPDVVSAERELAASSAEIGAAVADQLPSLSLTGSISRSGVSLNELATSWLFGPTLSLPIFNAGSRAAAVDTAEASYKAQLATYKQSIRTAIKEVEQDLVRLDSATKREAKVRASAERYRRYEATTNELYNAGGASALTLESARRNALSAEVNAITVQRDQIEYWIALYKAIGGGWDGLADASKQ